MERTVQIKKDSHETENKYVMYDSMYELLLDIWERPTEFAKDDVSEIITSSIIREGDTSQRYIPLCEVLAFLYDCEEFVDHNGKFCYGHRKDKSDKSITVKNQYSNIKAVFKNFYDQDTLKITLSHHDFFDEHSYEYHVKTPNSENELHSVDNMMMDMAIEIVSAYLIEMSVKHIQRSA